jgi:broad specificity phosphatase PhoE
VALVYLVQHAEKAAGPGEPGLTAVGLEQAGRVARWFAGRDVFRLYSSPLRRAVETAEAIAAGLGLSVVPDGRLRERVNWDGGCTFQSFSDDWERSVRDRDFVPPGGDSSREAGWRMVGFLRDMTALEGTVVAVTHGGVTTDLLRTLLGDESLPALLLRDGIPACALTIIQINRPNRDMQVTAMAEIAV